MTSRILRIPLRSEVKRLLLEGLLHGDPAPGSAVNETELSVKLGVSRTPLREALLALERERFIGSDPGKGFYVVPLTAREVEEIYPIIWTLEGLALRSTGVVRPARLEELARINGQLERAKAAPDAALRSDRLWHDTLLAGCANQRLLESIQDLKNQAHRYEYAYMKHSGKLITSVEQHREIIEALRDGDRRRAISLLERNWRVSLEFLIPWLAGEGARDRDAARTRERRA